MTLTERDVAVFTNAPAMANTDELTRTEWLALRRNGLGGSDAAAVLGLSKWTSPYTLWLDKTGRTPIEGDDGSTTRLRAGHHLEPFVIDEAQRAMDGLIVNRAPYMLRHPEHPCLFVDVDGFAALQTRRTRGGFEAKTAETMMAGEWADGVPAYYETQVFHSMAVTGLPWWVVAVLIGFGRIETYVVERDDDIIDALTAAEVAWWQRHVIEGEPPAIDGSKATTDALKLIEARAGTVQVVNPAEVEDLFRQLAHDKAVIDEATASANTVKNQLRSLLDEATELQDDAGRTWATWRQAKPSTVVHHDAAVIDAALALGVTVDELLARHTTTKPGSRTLRTAPGITLATKEN